MSSSSFICPNCFVESEAAEILFKCVSPSCNIYNADNEPIWPGAPYIKWKELNEPNGTVRGKLNVPPHIVRCPHCHQTTYSKACPHCRHELHPGILNSKTIILAVVGAPEAGKSVFMASMIHFLINEISPNFALRIEPSPETRRYYSQFLAPLFDSQNPSMPAKTNPVQFSDGKVNPTRPLMFYIERSNDKKKNVILVFYDAAGEDFGNDQMIHTVAPYINHCSGIIYLVDPFRMDTIRRRLKEYDEHILDCAPTNQNPGLTLDHLVTSIRHMQEQNNEKIAVPLAVTVSKLDLLLDMAKVGGEFFGGSAAIRGYYGYDGSLKDGILRAVSQEIRSFLHAQNASQVIVLANSFAHVRYFGVSALGHNTVPKKGTDNELTLSQPARPLRVLEPLLWLLSFHGIVDVFDRGQAVPNSSFAFEKLKGPTQVGDFKLMSSDA